MRVFNELICFNHYFVFLLSANLLFPSIAFGYPQLILLSVHKRNVDFNISKDDKINSPAMTTVLHVIH